MILINCKRTSVHNIHAITEVWRQLCTWQQWNETKDQRRLSLRWIWSFWWVNLPQTVDAFVDGAMSFDIILRVRRRKPPKSIAVIDSRLQQVTLLFLSLGFLPMPPAQVAVTLWSFRDQRQRELLGLHHCLLLTTSYHNIAWRHGLSSIRSEPSIIISAVIVCHFVSLSVC